MERFVYVGNNLITRFTVDGTAAAIYRFGPITASPLTGNFGGAGCYFHIDYVGSIVALTDGLAVTDTYRHGSYGEDLGTTGSTSNSFRYTAREHENDDLYYYRNRY